MADHNQTPTISAEARAEYREIVYVDYKDVDFLKRFLNEQGMLLPRRVTGVPSAMQRQLTRAVKRARHLALLPYAADTVR
ncbi:MAG TPA: 30S ribosomal protein S18 [Rhodothermales bacterium]|nr:30S ribosomal protein S18 [Rhodothermales bacterium]